MNVYVSWAYTGEARKAEERLVEWVDSLGKKTKAEKELLARLTPELCLPELIEFKELEADAPQYDKLNQNLLAVRFVTPKLGRTVTYQLGKRMPGSGKLALSLAARSHLLKTFEGEWEYESEKPKGKVTFVGHSGTGDFLTALRFACAAMGHPFPPCFEYAEVREYEGVREVLDAAAVNQQAEAEKAKYVDLLTGWLGPGASAARDGSTILSFGFLMGWEVAADDRLE